jgi:uncharacterized protein YqjF (DUF2071 family)
MLNFRVDPQVLVPHVPRGTRLDTWRGETWLSLVGFRFLETRVLGLPIPAHRNFLEINLRFYVRPTGDDRRAVVFLKEIVPRRAIAVVARAWYNEPYVTRSMRAEGPTGPSESPGEVAYAWRHRGRWNRFGVTAVGAPTPIGDGTDEEFIAEHYWGYTRQRNGSTVEYQVEHPRWSVWAVRDVQFDVDVEAEYGAAIAAALRDRPATALLADGSPVRVGRPKLLLV